MSNAHPYIGEVKAGSTIRVSLSVQDADGVDRDYSGASILVKFLINNDEDTLADVSGVLSGTPSSAPQAYFIIPAANTVDFSVPVLVDFYAKVTLNDGSVDIPSGRFRLIRGAP